MVRSSGVSSQVCLLIKAIQRLAFPSILPDTQSLINPTCIRRLLFPVFPRSLSLFNVPSGAPGNARTAERRLGLRMRVVEAFTFGRGRVVSTRSYPVVRGVNVRG